MIAMIYSHILNLWIFLISLLAMAWSIPGKGTAQSNVMSQFFSEDFNILVDGIGGLNCVLSGGACTAQGTPDMTVAVAKAAVLTNGVLKAVAAGNATIGAANATNPRIDLVVINSAGAIATRAGTAAAAPVPPARTANDVVLCRVWVPANDTTISSDQITDLRVLRTGGPITIFKNTSVVTTNTSVAAVTMLTATIPSGLFLSGKNIHGRLGGNFLLNSGTPTVTLSISYGGTTMAADVSSAATADTDRLAWYIDFNLLASANAVQNLSGVVALSPVGAKTAPTTGNGLDLLTPAALANVPIVCPFQGTAAVDSDAGDRVLLVTWTMNVSNAADEVVCSGAVLDIS